MSKVYIAGATVISGLVVALVVVVLWAMGSAAEDRDRFSSLEIAPHDAVFLAAINTKPDSSQWIGFSGTLDLINAKEPLNDAINDALARFNLVFEDDIIPLAGDEAYVAITDFDKLASDEGGLLVGIRVQDLDRARDVFLNIMEEDGTELASTDYNGVEIFYTDISLDSVGDSPTAAAFVDDVMLIATTPEEIEGAIDVVRGDAQSAADNPSITELSSRQDGDFIAWGYLDLSVLWDEVESQTDGVEASDGLDTDRLLEEARNTADRLTFSISTRGDGSRMDVSVFHSDDYEPSEYPTLADEFETHFADSVPADTLFYAAGYDIYDQTYLPIKDLLEEMQVDQDGQTVDDIISDFEDEVGFNFEDDLISLLTREYAVAVNASDFNGDTPDFDVLALFDVDDPGRIEQTVSDLGDYLERKELIGVNETDRGGVYEWSEFGGSGPGVTWTVVGDTLAFGYPEDSVLQYVDGSGEKLSDTKDWKQTRGQLSDRTTSFAFVSLARILDEVKRVDGTREDFEKSTDGKVTLDDLEPIRSIGVASANIDGGWQFSVILLVTD